MSETTTRVTLNEATWRAHAGDWIAVLGGQLVAAADTYYRTLGLLSESGITDPDVCDFVAWVPRDDRVRFDRWRERVVAAHLEFRRRPPG